MAAATRPATRPASPAARAAAVAAPAAALAAVVALAALLLAAGLARAQSPCDGKTTCFDCIFGSQNQCGWCHSARACHQGKAAGPLDEECNGTDWYWSQCPECGAYETCAECGPPVGCGWCTETDECERASESSCSPSNFHATANFCGACKSDVYNNATWGTSGAGGVATGVCQLGFEGSPTRICGSGGVWAPETGGIPCEYVGLCQGHVAFNAEWPTIVVGQTVTVPCMEGFVGNVTRNCTADNVWSAPEGACHRDQCPSVVEGSAHWSQSNRNTTVAGECVTGYFGSPTRYCNVTGEWGPIHDPCEVASVTNFYIIVGASVAGFVALVIFVVAVVLVHRRAKKSMDEILSSDHIPGGIELQPVKPVGDDFIEVTVKAAGPPPPTGHTMHHINTRQMSLVSLAASGALAPSSGGSGGDGGGGGGGGSGGGAVGGSAPASGTATLVAGAPLQRGRAGRSTAPINIVSARGPSSSSTAALIQPPAVPSPVSTIGSYQYNTTSSRAPSEGE